MSAIKLRAEKPLHMGAHGIPHEEFWARRLARRQADESEQELMREVLRLQSKRLDAGTQREIEQQAQSETMAKMPTSPAVAAKLARMMSRTWSINW